MLPQSSPRYRLVLSFPEFSLLHDIARVGVAKYGVEADLNVRIVNTGTRMVWVVTVMDPRIARLLDDWTAERVSELVNRTNFMDGVSDSTGVLLEIAKSIDAKLTEARADPVWDRLTISGMLTKPDTTWSVETDSGSVRLDVSGLPAPPLELVGHEVFVVGAVRTANRLDAIRILERKQNTLELFTMSLCPFGEKAAADIITRLQSGEAGSVPALQIHYIFYVQRTDSIAAFTSLQGEDEVREDLVQMLIRDNHPKAYWPYLLLRAQSADSSSWRALADKVGLTSTDIDRIAEQVVAERDELIGGEYDYVARACRIYDGSPAFIWEGKPVQQLSEVPFFSDVPPSERCWSASTR